MEEREWGDCHCLLVLSFEETRRLTFYKIIAEVHFLKLHETYCFRIPCVCRHKSRNFLFVQFQTDCEPWSALSL
jgi:hypothetical protein